MCKTPVQSSSHLLHGESLKSRKILSAYLLVVVVVVVGGGRGGGGGGEGGEGEEEEEGGGGGGGEGEEQGRSERHFYIVGGGKKSNSSLEGLQVSPARPSGRRCMKVKMYEEGRYKGDSNTLKQGLRNFSFSLMPKGVIGKLYLVIFTLKQGNLFC